MENSQIYLPSKPRYEILDGLRGVAALLVVAFHLFETYSSGPAHQIINHGYLAVDFFFVLSGFVIGYAYDDRWNRMTLGTFFKRRLTRLHPMVIAGTLIGAALFFFAGTAFPKTLETEGWKFALCLIMGLLMIPCGPGLDIRGWSEMNSFNGPNWSLTFEYVANILYTVIFRHLSKVALFVLCCASALLTLDLTLGWDIFGLFPDAVRYNVIGGWSIDPQNIYIGFSRLLYPFLCGLLISRILASRITGNNPSGSPLHLKGGFWWCSVAVVVIFSTPCVGGRQCLWDGLYQAICILVLFPVIVLAGAGSKTTDVKSTAICRWLGDISYPLYITHFPLIYMQMNWVVENGSAPLWQHIAVSSGVFLLSIVLAWGLLAFYDEPVRRWLKEHLFR